VTDPTRAEAFFGGWTTRSAAGGTLQWGPPHRRVQEFLPSAITTVVLPTADRAGQRGVPLWVLNRGTAQLVVRRPSDNAVVWTLAAGSAACFVLGSDWFGWPIGTVQVGSVFPALRYSVDVWANTANLDMLERVVAQGYDGAQPVVVTCTVRAGAAVGTTDRLLRALTTGGTFGGVSWAAGSFALLVVEANALVGGWGGGGGRGGAPGTGAATGNNGENGGQAIRAEIPLRIDCQGLIFGGGGGGGGGGSSTTQLTVVGAGGGGARGANMATGGVLLGSPAGGATTPAGPGTGGGPFSFGAGGLGTGGGGNGGNGGAAATNGGAGGVSSTGAAGGAAGLAGAAISYLAAAGAPTILAGGSNILGTTVAEAT
jgi:hypothetical protein